jgi:hypothetical protein
MKGQTTALGVAIGLLTVPQRVRAAKREPLPDDVLSLLRIAGGDASAEAEAVRRSGRSAEVIRKAAAFYIEQVLLTRESDAYRVLGASPEASSADLRRNMALLLRWLHPDIDRKGERSIFAGRVTAAWEELKTPERRAAYDRKRLQSRAASRQKSRSNGRAAPASPLSSDSRGAGNKRVPGLLRSFRLASAPVTERIMQALSRLIRKS